MATLNYNYDNRLDSEWGRRNCRRDSNVDLAFSVEPCASAFCRESELGHWEDEQRRGKDETETCAIGGSECVNTSAWHVTCRCCCGDIKRRLDGCHKLQPKRSQLSPLIDTDVMSSFPRTVTQTDSQESVFPGRERGREKPKIQLVANRCVN